MSWNIIPFLVFFTILFTIGITGASDDFLDAGGDIPQLVTISAVMDDSTRYTDTSLRIEGKITSMCGSGCWFILSDTTGDIYVTLKPNNFVIPPSMGKQVVVEGYTQEKNGDIIIIAHRVLVEGKAYP